MAAWLAGYVYDNNIYSRENFKLLRQSLYWGPMHVIYIYTYKIKISSRSLYEKFLSGYDTKCTVLQQIKRGLQLENSLCYI